MAKWSELYGISGSKYTKDTVDFLDKTGHEYFSTPAPRTVRSDISGTLAGFKEFDYKDALTYDSAKLMSESTPSIASTSLLDKYRASFVQKTPQELATNPVSKFFQGVSSGFISGAVDVVRGAGTVIEAGVGKIADDIKTGRFVDNLTKMPGDTQALKDDWSRFIDKRKETKIDATLAPAISTVRQGMVQESKAAQAGSFVGGAGAYATLAGASGLVGVAPLFLSSLDNSISTIEAEGKDIKTLDAMARAFGTAAVEVGTEYLFNVLGGMGSKGAAIAARSTIGRSALSRVTGLYDNMAIKASSMFGKFVASTPNPTLTKYVSFLLAKGNEEGFEELASYIGSGMIQLWTTDKDKKPSEVMNAKDAATNYLLGGVMGFAISAVKNVDGLLAAMPQSKAKIDSISNKPITEVTADEMSDVINTIAEEGQAPVVQNITSQMTQKAASVAETVNATADTEYAEEIAKPIEQATATAQINVDETLASIDSNIEEFINTQQDAPSDWKAEFMRKFSLQHLALKSLAQRIDMEAPEGKRLSEHIRKLGKLISSRVANPRIRNLVEEYLSDKYIFHNIVTDQMAEDEARKIPTDELGWKRLYKRLGNSQYAPTKAEAIVVYDEMTRLMSLTNPTDAEIATLGKLEQIVMKKSSLAGSALQAWSYIAKRTPEYEASMIIKKAEPMFDTAKTKQGREVVDGLVDDSKKARKKAADDTADKIQKDINESGKIEDEFSVFSDVMSKEEFEEPEGIPTELEGIIGDFEEVASESIEKEPTMEETLAKKIRKDFNKVAKTTKEKTKADEIVDYLFKAYKDVVPTAKEKKSPKTDEERFAFIAQVMMDKTVYDEVWSKAKDIVGEFAEGNETFEPFFAKFDSLYRTQLVKSAVRMNLKSMGISLNKIAKEYYLGNRNATVSGFMDSLKANLKKSVGDQMSTYDFNFLFDQVYKELSAQIETKKEAIMKAEEERIAKEKAKADKKKKDLLTSSQIAKLIKNRLNWKEKPAPQNQIERKIVRALYDRFAETIPSIPKKAKPTDDDLFQFVGIMAYDNKTINKIWEDAQKVIADVDTKGYNLDEFMEIINPLYNEKLVRKLMLANLKSIGINIRDMMRAHFSLEDVAFDSFSAILRNNLEKNLSVKISDADFAYLDNMIRQEMETSIENEKIKMVVAFHKKLEKMFSKKVSADDRNRAIAELTDMAMSNAFDEPLIADSWKKRLGIKDFTNEMRERIHETLRQIAVLKLNNGDQDDINKLYDDMIHDIAKSAPAEMKEKYSSFRRMAMLLNPGTWVRNSVANNIAAAFYGVSDRMQMFAEGKLRIPSEYRRFYGQLIDVKGDSDIANVVKIRATDKSMTRSMRRSAKYGIESAVGYEKNIFDNATLQAINDFSKHILSGDFEGNRLKVLNFLGDKPVYEHHYRVAMANSLAAQGYSESLSPVAKEQMIQQAMAVAENIATRRVFRQMNWVSQKLLNLKKTNKVADAVISVMQPFIITPTAVAYEAYLFSPVALAVETGKLIASGISNKGIQNIPVETRMKIAESLPQALTGTVGQVVIGYLLASFGFLTAGWPDSEKEREQWKLQGKSPYSLYIPDVGSFSIDWAQPVAVGITMGAQFQQSKGDPSKISEAMFNSLLGGSIIENFTKSYGKDVWTSIAVDTATDGIIQNFPTLLKKVGDSIDPFERDVYQGSALNILGNRALSYIPGGSYLIPAKVDVWGNPIQKTQTEGVAGAAVRTVRALLLPFTVKESNMDDTTRKVYDVFKASGKSDALPKVAPQKFTYNKVDYELDGKEYVLFQQELGTRSKSLVDSVINKPEFDEMSPELQAKVLKRMYDRALEQAKATIVQKIS